MTYLCRTGRLSAALRSPGSFLAQVTAHRQRDLALSPRRGHASLCASVRGLASTSAHLGTQRLRPQPFHARDSSGFVIAEWRHLDCADTIAEHLSQSAQTESRCSDITRQPLVGAKRRQISGGERLGEVLFQGNWGVSSCSNRTMQLRASSTAAGSRKSEEHTADSSKGDEQNLKEASAVEKGPVKPEPEGGKPNKTQQLKKVFKEYGAVGVSFHIGISLMSLGMFYLLLSSGIDMVALLGKLGFSEAVVSSKMAAGTSTFVLAYAVHKLFAPVRMSITLVSVPLIVRYFRKTGLFKPPTPAP